MNLKKVLFLTFLIVISGCICVYASDYYVDSSYTGVGDGSLEKPFSSIQSAADIVNPGDVVTVKKGIYYESVDFKRTGTAEKPIVFKAEDSSLNAVTVTGADKNIREGNAVWTLEDAEKQLYSVPFDYQMSKVLCNGANLMAYRGVNSLKKFIAVGSAGSSGEYMRGAEHGFYYDKAQKKLYVRLNESFCKNGSLNPKDNLICVSGREYNTDVPLYIDGKAAVTDQNDGIGDGSYNFGVISEDKPAYITFYGFTFETPGFTGVYIRSTNVTVSNCWFRGCAAGVSGGARHKYDAYNSSDITVEYCDFTHFPVFEDGINIIEKFGDHLKNTPNAATVFNWQTKGTTRGRIDFEHGGFVSRAGDRWTIRNNHISETLDGLSYYWTYMYYEWDGDAGRYRLKSSGGHKVYNNKFENCVDNAIELEYGAHDVEIYGNLFLNTMLGSISWQPGTVLPMPTNITLHHNIFYNEEDINRLYVTKMATTSSFFKSGVRKGLIAENAWLADKYYYYIEWKGYNPKGIRLEDKGLVFYNNTIINPMGKFEKSSGVIGAASGNGVKDGDANVHFTNNIILTMPGLGENLREEYGISESLPEGQFSVSDGKYEYKANLYIPYGSGTEIKNDCGVLDNGGFTKQSLEDAGIYEANDGSGVFYLKKDSAARNCGVHIEGVGQDLSDLGAVPYGGTFNKNFGPYRLGDVNCDGLVDLKDFILISEAVSGGGGSRCDINFDGVTDRRDLELITEIIAKGENAN